MLPPTTLTPQKVIFGYTQGLFPMGQGNRIYWYDPEPRAILPFDQWHIPRRLAQTSRLNPYTIRYNTAFRRVMERCAEPTEQRPTSWITPPLLRTYTQLHQLGFAHSVEAWQNDQLVGGLYGVAIGGFFAGESMFSRATDASKLCLVALVARLQAKGFSLLDTQYTTPHLAQFGVVEISRQEYKKRLEAALALSVRFEE